MHATTHHPPQPPDTYTTNSVSISLQSVSAFDGLDVHCGARDDSVAQPGTARAAGLRPRAGCLETVPVYAIPRQPTHPTQPPPDPRVHAAERYRTTPHMPRTARRTPHRYHISPRVATRASLQCCTIPGVWGSWFLAVLRSFLRSLTPGVHPDPNACLYRRTRLRMPGLRSRRSSCLRPTTLGPELRKTTARVHCPVATPVSDPPPPTNTPPRIACLGRTAHGVRMFAHRAHCFPPLARHRLGSISQRACVADAGRARWAPGRAGQAGVVLRHRRGGGDRYRKGKRLLPGNHRGTTTGEGGSSAQRRDEALWVILNVRGVNGGGDAGERGRRYFFVKLVDWTAVLRGSMCARGD